MNLTFVARIGDLVELKRAINALESHYPAPRKPTPEEQTTSDAIWAKIYEDAWQYRKEHLYDPANPEPRVWQDELYDASGLPK